MSVRLKLILFGALSVITLISVAGLAQHHINELRDTINMYRSQAEGLQAYFHLSSEFSDLSESYKDAIIEVMMGNKPKDDTGTMKNRIDSLVQAVNRLNSGDANARISTGTETETGTDSDIAEVLAGLKQPLEKGAKSIDDGDSYGASETYMAAIKKPSETLKKAINKKVLEAKDLLNASTIIITQRNETNRKLFAVSILFILVLTAIISFFLSRSITRPFKSIFQGLKTFSKKELADLAGQFKEVINSLTNGATSVASASEQMAQGASEQASGIEEASSSLEEMSCMTKSNAEKANQANRLMKETDEVIEGANTSMKELTCSIEEISEASEETQKIVKTIDEIAFQTNLLALNAAVEAARAGDVGTGFAVVADEVKTLAMRAAEAAQNTADLIANTVRRVNDGSDLVLKTNEAFEQVSGSAGKIGEIVSEISTASNEQAQGIEQVNRAISGMDKVVQSNAAGTEELSSQSEELKSLVNVLLTVVKGDQGNRDS